jgi:uncharacterized protein (TIGR02145 family)
MKGLFIPIVIGFMIISCEVFSQTSSQQEKRIALVIGNGNYLIGSLANPENDARAMKTALQNVGFEVIEYENLNQGQIKKAIDEFGEKMKTYDVGLFYYAGHGIQSNGYNYLIPVDAQLTNEKQVEYDCVQADRVLALMEGSGTKVNIIILDACRNNPFERSWTRSTTGRGLAFMNAPSGTLIAYATSPGSTASDGSGENGLYTSAILESIKIPDITILQMFQNVRRIVTQISNKGQVPWESTSLIGDFYFLGSEDSQENYLLIEDAKKTKIEELSRGEFVDQRDGDTYKWVKIGKQIWMAENMKTSKYNDGTSIPLITDENEWYKLSSPAYCLPRMDTIIQKTSLGALYNWYAVNSNKICPKGWHIPSDNEWTVLIDYLGGKGIAGGKLKEAGTIDWLSPNKDATNETGFTALAAGGRSQAGFIGTIKEMGAWWSSTEEGNSYAWFRMMNCYNNEVIRYHYFKNNGFSVRCVRDN